MHLFPSATSEKGYWGELSMEHGVDTALIGTGSSPVTVSSNSNSCCVVARQYLPPGAELTELTGLLVLNTLALDGRLDPFCDTTSHNMIPVAHPTHSSLG